MEHMNAPNKGGEYSYAEYVDGTVKGEISGAGQHCGCHATGLRAVQTGKATCWCTARTGGLPAVDLICRQRHKNAVSRRKQSAAGSPVPEVGLAGWAGGDGMGHG